MHKPSGWLTPEPCRLPTNNTIFKCQVCVYVRNLLACLKPKNKIAMGVLNTSDRTEDLLERY